MSSISTYCSNAQCKCSVNCQRHVDNKEDPKPCPTYFLSRLIIKKMGFDCFYPKEESVCEEK